MSEPGGGGRVAVIAAFQSATTVGPTVDAVTGLVDRVIVVDDGSTDGTADAAVTAGADVVVLSRNRGKGAALSAGVAASPEAAVYLLVDADTGSTAVGVAPLLGAVEAGDADLAIGVLPPAGAKAGQGRVKELARWGIRSATGLDVRAPLSGQRAVRGSLLRELLPFAPRFGVETAMTLDAARRGATVVEIDVEMDHRHTGRRLPGVVHRARQGVDVLRALWPRVLPPPSRAAAVVIVGAAIALVAIFLGSASVPSGGAPLGRSEQVVVVALPDLRWEDLDRLPTVKDLAGSRGAAANATVGTPGDEPTASATWASAGAGDRMAGFDLTDIPHPPPDEPLRVTTMVESLNAQNGRHASSSPGALGDALGRAGIPTGLVARPGSPVGLAIADRTGRTAFAATGEIGGPAEPALSMLRRGVGVVVVDATGLDAATLDPTLTRIVDGAGQGTLVIAVAGSSVERGFELKPIVVSGPGARSGSLASPTTRRQGLVSLVDVAPTVLEVLGVPRPEGMVGRPLRRTGAMPDLDALSRARRDSDVRARSWLALSVVLGTASGLVFLASFVPVLRRQRALQYLALIWASWPLACLLVDAVPRISALGPRTVGGATIVLAGAIAAVVGRGGLRLPALGWLGGATALAYAADLATGGHLQFNSTLGVSAATTNRFTGLPNTGFAVFAAGLVVAGAALRRDTAISRTTLAVLFVLGAFVVAWPTLGGDAGGLVTLAPVLFVLWLKLAGPVPWRRLVTAGLLAITAIGLLGLADRARPEDARTHIGRFLAGDTDVSATVARRLDSNLATYTLFPALLVVVAALLAVLLLTGRWRSLFPGGSVERAAAGAIIAIALVGNVVNDSGAVVTALAMLFLVPLIYLAADQRERPRMKITVAG